MNPVDELIVWIRSPHNYTGFKEYAVTAIYWHGSKQEESFKVVVSKRQSSIILKDSLSMRNLENHDPFTTL